MATAVIAAIPVVVSAVSSLAKLWGKSKPSDPLEAATDAIPPESIGAYVGSDGWWYDNADNHQLSHDEASTRQHAFMAAAVHAKVGTDGWWYDLVTNARLSHAEAYARFQALSGGGGTVTPVGPTDPAYTYTQQQIQNAINAAKLAAANIGAVGQGAIAGAVGGADAVAAAKMAQEKTQQLVWLGVGALAIVGVLVIMGRK